MTKSRSIIEIEMNRKYITRQIGVTDLEYRILERMRYLRNRGHETMILRVTESQAVISAIYREKRK